MQKIKLETDRLYIRDFTSDDFAAVHAYGTDPETVEFLPWGPNTEDDTRQALERFESFRTAEPRVYFELALQHKALDKLIGAIGIRIRDVQNKSGDIGYVLNREFWQQGFMSEATLAIVKFGFETLELERIWATCDPQNISSQKLLEKCSFNFEGELKRSLFLKGVWQNSCLYAITRPEWEKNR